MPGDLPGWTRVYAQDFLTDQSPGTWPGAYASTVYGYDCDDWGIRGGCDTSKRGDYDRKAVVSAKAGVMNYHVRTNNGVPKVAAEGPAINGQPNSQVYGRYSVRFRVDRGLTGYKSAWLLWPASNDWDEGEIDFPEGDLDGDIEGFNHCPGDPARNCYAFDTGVRMDSGWHTATIEWLPSSLRFYLDGALRGTTTTGVPATPFRWVLQTETNLDGSPIPPAAAGHVQIDWMVMWRRG
jgi:beta-glucanase (GH16 family)